MILETYLDEKGETVSDLQKARYIRITSFDDEIGIAKHSWIIDIQTNIQKTKVYISNPSEAPQGSSVNRGKYGGLYYESEEQRSFERETSNIEQNIKQTMKFSESNERDAQNAIQKHITIAKNEFNRIVTEVGGNISYRIKNKYSILEKLKRKNYKPIDDRISDIHYPEQQPYKISDMQDIFGIRIKVNNVNEIYNVISKLEKIYGDKIITKEDYVKSPKGLYRSYHINIDYGNQIYGEIQVRTELMDKINMASHILFYKNYEDKDKDINLKNVNETLQIYSKIAIGQAKQDDLHPTLETVKILRGFGL